MGGKHRYGHVYTGATHMSRCLYKNNSCCSVEQTSEPNNQYRECVAQNETLSDYHFTLPTLNVCCEPGAHMYHKPTTEKSDVLSRNFDLSVIENRDHLEKPH